VDLYDTYEDLLGSLFPNPNNADAASLARITRSQTRRLHYLDHRLEHLRNDPPIEGGLKAHVEEDTVAHQRETLLEEITLANNYLGKALSSPSGKAGPADLSSILLYRCDWSNRNFHNVDLEGAKLDGINLKGAELRGINSFQNSNWTGTAWWEAKSIDQDLLRYLAVAFPYRQSEKYPWVSQITPNDYDQNVQRLQAELLSRK
jgi:hypothetical protein